MTSPHCLPNLNHAHEVALWVQNDFVTGNSAEWLVHSTESVAWWVTRSVKIGLEVQMYKAGESLQSLTAFLLFLKIVITTVISVSSLCSWLCPWVFHWSLKDWSAFGSPRISETVAPLLSLSGIRAGPFSVRTRDLFSTSLTYILQFHCHYIHTISSVFMSWYTRVSDMLLSITMLIMKLMHVGIVLHLVLFAKKNTLLKFNEYYLYLNMCMVAFGLFGGLCKFGT